MLNAIPINGETWLVCGGRAFADPALFDSAMSDLIRIRGIPSVVIHGAASGADTMAGEWARRLAVDLVPFPAKWTDLSHPDAVIRTRRDGSCYDALAGHRRNQQMLDEGRPTLVVAFPGGTGTADMTSRARKAGIEVAEIKIGDRDG